MKVDTYTAIQNTDDNSFTVTVTGDEMWMNHNRINHPNIRVLSVLDRLIAEQLNDRNSYTRLQTYIDRKVAHLDVNADANTFRVTFNAGALPENIAGMLTGISAEQMNGSIERTDRYHAENPRSRGLYSGL